MQVAKIALMGLTLALMAPSIQATEPNDQKTADIQDRYPLTLGQKATSVMTGISTGLLLCYGSSIWKVSPIGLGAAVVALAGLKAAFLDGELPENGEYFGMNNDETVKFYATMKKKNEIDLVATLITILGVLAADAAMCHITAL